MKIAFDVDGVLANFAAAYQNLIVKTIGRDDFHAGDAENPPTWDWPKMRGYSSSEKRKVWDIIIASDTFWENLQPLEGLEALRVVYDGLCDHHDVYFITSRAGKTAKAQSENWLLAHLEPYAGLPTTLISSEKGYAAKALDLDVYIDDYLPNVLSVREHSPRTRVYCYDRRYNQPLLDREAADYAGYTRVPSLQAMLDAELVNFTRS